MKEYYAESCSDRSDGGVISSIVKRGKGRTKSVGCFGSVTFDHGNFII